MKASLILSLLICIGLSQINLAQTSIKTYKKDSDQKTIELRMEEEKVVYFRINGKVINKEDYKLYQDIINKMITDVPAPPIPPITPTKPAKPVSDKEDSLIEDNLNDIFASQIKSLLHWHNLLEPNSKFSMKLTYDYLKVNSKKTNRDIHQQAIEIYEKVLNRKFSTKTRIKIKEQNGNKIISIIENRTFYIDSELDY